jgi:two-component system cell cycle response regulator DivK
MSMTDPSPRPEVRAAESGRMGRTLLSEPHAAGPISLESNTLPDHRGPRSRPPPPMKILLIEDNEANRYLATYLLERAGHTVVHAATGPAGIGQARVESFDLVLLDIQLPGMDGYEVARALRQLPGLARTPIVAVTSYAMPGDCEKALAAGCTGYIEKPINPHTFVSQLEACLQRPPAAGGCSDSNSFSSTDD